MAEGIAGWDDLHHSGLLLDSVRLSALASEWPLAPLHQHVAHELRRRAATLLGGLAGDEAHAAEFVAFVLEQVCGFDAGTGTWARGSNVAPAYGRRAVTGEVVKPRQLWKGVRGARLPVFFDSGANLGLGKSRRVVSQVLGWLRAGDEQLALVTNGRQLRLVFAGMDFDASCQWDAGLWFEEGELAPQVTALRSLLRPELWTPPKTEGNEAPPLLQAIRNTRKGQAELSEVLGERVREAVELLIQSHGEALQAHCANVPPADIYRAACRVVMRLVIVLFAESRDLLPRDNALYHLSYGLGGLFERLQREAVRGSTLAESLSAWPRVLALFRLVYEGSHFPDLPVPAYGGELFAPATQEDGLSRALAVFESACFEGAGCCSDGDVHSILKLLTRTTVRIRQGRGSVAVAAPVDFSDLSSEYIGIVYEGVLDYELKIAPAGDPVIFLAVGDQPALPLSRLEAMPDSALKRLFESLKKPSDTTAADSTEEVYALAQPDALPPQEADIRQRNRTRAENWARRAAQVAGLVPNRRRAEFEQQLAAIAKRLVARVVLPGEWYLVRWGGTRKGSGTFHTRPALAVPTVQRTLRPLAFDPPLGKDGKPNTDAPAAQWTPKLPEEILSLKVADPACGSGTFPLAALRFLTDALFLALQHHQRIEPDGDAALIHLLRIRTAGQPADEHFADELIPCRMDDDAFEPRLKAVLRRHVVERCLYAVDFDPLAVELCRLSLWIETLDRTLPFGFLDHKVKCGNALIGAWFDQFSHYPAMAWKNRDGGDRNHNGVHFAKNARTQALKAFVKERLTPDLALFLRGADLFQHDLLQSAAAVHGQALNVLVNMHAMPVRDAAARAETYRREFEGSPAWQGLKAAMDLWCACWFWPPSELDCAPLPRTFTAPSAATRAVAKRLAEALRFFHWELEFPDVFDAPGAGFDALLGNPPWDIAKPVSKEFFSNIDPLYRSYGKQEALRKQTEYFKNEEGAEAGWQAEENWLDYNARFRAQSNFTSHAASPFGDPAENAASQSRFAVTRGKDNHVLHDNWRRERTRGQRSFADPAHPFRHQGSADLNLYKLFLEAGYALLKFGGRLGFVVPSGLYSDNGTGALRRLFLEHCRWEWLFGIENRDRVFPIHRSYKFNPVIVQKGGTTEAIRTAFMRRNLDDWEHAEALATPYTRAQVTRFSPKSRAILEIQSARDLEILEKIYKDSVLLGDDGPKGWGIRYATEFHMTNDSRLFPPRPQWEAKGYRPDEYSRWLLGDWRPIGELWAELGVDPSRPEPVGVALEEWLFDTSAGPERRIEEARFAHGHLLKPGDVARTPWRVRCAQAPYDRLPVARADIPGGVVLSREGDAWIREDRVWDVALPLYEGRMIGQFDSSQKGWISGKGRGSVWRDIPWEHKQVEPQYLMAASVYRDETEEAYVPKVLHMRVGSATNTRTAIASFACGVPSGDTAASFYAPQLEDNLMLTAVLNSLAFDFVTRARLTGLHLDYHVWEQNPLPAVPRTLRPMLAAVAFRLIADSKTVASQGLRLAAGFATGIADAERRRLAVVLDAVVAVLYGLARQDLVRVIEDCDDPPESTSRSDAKGLWRVDKDRTPELRQTVLTLLAFESLLQHGNGDPQRGMANFLAQDGDDWLLPETVRLADYGLGHDDRAKHHQPVASRLGPRFYDWQLVQTADEALRERHRHARNLLGELDYARLLRDAERTAQEPTEEPLRQVAEPRAKYQISQSTDDQTDIFE